MLNGIKTLLGALSRPRGNGNAPIYIGESFSRLEKRRIISYNYNGRSIQLASAIEWKWSKRREHVAITAEYEPNPHILITGMSGHGKSTLLESIVAQLRNNGKNVLLFDVHNEHGSIADSSTKVIDAHYNSVNPLALDGLAVNQRISNIVSMLKSLYGLGHIQSTKLSQCLWYMYRKHGAMSQYSTEISSIPTINELVNEISIFISNAKGASERNALLHLKTKVSGLSKPGFIKDTVSVKQLMSGTSIISLSEVRSREELFVYVTTILERVYYLMRSKSINKGVSTYIVIDEAQYLIGSSDGSASIIRKLVEEGRKYGIAMLLVTPSISSIDRSVIANTSTIISFALREPSEVSYMSRLMSLGTGADRTIMSALTGLRKGEAIFLCNRAGTMLIRVAKAVQRNTDSGSPEILRQKAAALSIKPVKRGMLASDVGDSVVSSMIGSGELSVARRASPVGVEEWVMKKSGAFTIDHELSVRKIAELLSRAGIVNRVEDNANNPDIIAYHNGMTIAIEYETGSKPAASTIEMLEKRKGKYDYIVVVSPGKSADRFGRETPKN